MPVQVVVLLNGGGGALSRMGEDAALATIGEAMARLGIVGPIQWCVGERLAAEAKRVADEAKAGRFEAVIAGGGDGTVSLLAGGMAGSDTPLGILPLGTLNHFARDLGIPLEIEPALAVIAARNVRSVDLAEVNGRVFINNASIGIYPQFVETRSAITKGRRIPKAVAATAAAAASLARFRLRRVRLKMEGSAEAVTTPVLLISNNMYDPNRLTSRQALDSGRLGVWVARATTRLAFLRLALGAVAGRLPATLDLSETTRAEVGSRRHQLAVALDGEVAMLATPLAFTIRPGALKVLAPPAVEA